MAPITLRWLGGPPRVDEVFLERGELHLERTGVARYVLRFLADDDALRLACWTTRRGRIAVSPRPERPPWVSLATDGEALVALHAVDVSAHLEQLDRGAYFLGLARGVEHWGLTLASRGYIEVRWAPLPAPAER